MILTAEKRYFLRHGEEIEYIKEETVRHFHEAGMSVKNVPTSLYADIYYGMVVAALNNISCWNKMNSEVIDHVYKLCLDTVRQDVHSSEYFNVYENDDLINMSLIRLCVCLRKNFPGEEMSEDLAMDIRDTYYNKVLDSVFVTICRELENVFGLNGWHVFDLVKHRYGSEVITYGDFRHIAWEVFNLKSMTINHEVDVDDHDLTNSLTRSIKSTMKKIQNDPNMIVKSNG